MVDWLKIIKGSGVGNDYYVVSTTDNNLGKVERSTQMTLTATNSKGSATKSVEIIQKVRSQYITFTSINNTTDILVKPLLFTDDNGNVYPYEIYFERGIGYIKVSAAANRMKSVHESWSERVFNLNILSIDFSNSEIEHIGDYLFDRCGLEKVILGNTLISIGKDSFAGLNIETIDIPYGTTTIGEAAFSACRNLTSIYIPDSVTSIEGAAFSGCRSLTSIDIPESVTSIGNSTFWECTSLTSINIPDSVISIDAYAFWSCSNLTSINIPEGVTSIANQTFYGCSSLTSINIPDSVTSIDEGAFLNCTGLTSVNIPYGVTTIGVSAFHSCKSLTSIVIPEGVTNIGNEAFSNCRNLGNITFNGTISQWDAINKGVDWHIRVPATVVHCTDGDTPI